MPSERERRQVARDRADQQLLRRAAALLREEPGRERLDRDDGLALAELLDVLATVMPDVDPTVRRQAVESCRALLDDP